jgi:hypothetical protein
VAGDLRRARAESVALEVELNMIAQDVLRLLDQAVRERACAPEYLRSDNRPEFIATLEAKVLGRKFREDYNHMWTLASLGCRPPAEYAPFTRRRNQAELS